MKIGVLVETEEGLDWDHWRSVVAAVERLGFDSLWISDHLESPWTVGRRGLEAWTALTVAAAMTERVTLGPLVSPVTFREPGLVARMAANLAELTHRRFVVGLGLGWNVDEHAAAGIQFPSASERVARLVSTIERVRKESGAPILIGGSGPRVTLPMVARYADEWNVTPSSLEAYVRSAEALAQLCRDCVRDSAEIRRSVAMGVLVGRGDAELRDRSERMRHLVKPLAEVENVVSGARRMGWVAGAPSDVIQAILAYGEAGVQRVILGHYDLDDPSVLELVAREVLPAVA